MKAYAVVDPTLTTGQKAVQAAHALMELSSGYDLKSLGWNGSIVLLQPRSKSEFFEALSLISKNTDYNSIFFEPYYGDKPTAIAFLENGSLKDLLRSMRLIFT